MKRAFVPLVVGLTALIVIVLGFIVFRPGPSVPHAASPTGFGDACLVGTWTLQRENYQLSDSTTHTSLSGLGGAVLVINPNGTAFLSYTKSSPATGHSNTHKESITLRGVLSARVHASKGSLTVTDGSNQVAQMVTLDGKAQSPTGFSTPLAGSGPYSCNAQQLQIHLQSKRGTQVVTYDDTYLRGLPPSPSPSH